MSNAGIIVSLLDFIRARLCVSAVFISVSGFLLFNPLSTQLIAISLATFFICAGVYAYNNVTDKKEDSVNRGEINRLSERKRGVFIVILLFGFGLISALYHSLHVFVVSMLFVLLGTIYSRYRIKSYLLVKNLYTAMLISLFFLLGAGRFEGTLDYFVYYLLFFTLVFLGSVISDLRDLKGDGASGLKTLPVVFGYGAVKRMVYVVLILAMVFALYVDPLKLFPIIPSLFIMFYFVMKNKPDTAHFFETLSIIFLVVWLL